MESRVYQMLQTPSADKDNIQVSDIMTQTPNARQQPMPNLQNHHQKLLQEEQRTTLDELLAPYECSNSSAKNFPSSSSSLQGPTPQTQINDLLAHIRAGGTLDNGTNVVYDPSIGQQGAEFAELTKVGTMDQVEAINASFKGFNYSSGSNSSAKIIADNCMLKKDTSSDEDTTSADAAAHQRLEDK